MKYATQRFVMPGGELVRVQITGEHEYIEISGGGGTLTMDSGVVEVFNIAAMNPARYTPGVLAESNAVEQYNAAFTTVTANGRKNPGDTSDGQLSGRITESGNVIKGLLYGETTGSFIPAYDPATEAASVADDSLAAKKRMAVLCPASIFTGKCRMFVQAMYGQHLYQKGGIIPNVGPQLDESQVTGVSAPPALLLQEYTKTGETGTGLNVQLHTSCGVYLDAIGQHWLFAPTTGSVIVYPLIGSPSAEALRKLLWDSPDVPVSKRLNSTDREHLEAYILSTCRPYVLRKQTPPWPISITPYGMGYGWHWNWDTNKADIVINERIVFDISYNDMRSTHHRVSVTKATPVDAVTNPDGSVTNSYLDIEFEASVVEGPTTWTIDRTQMSIAEPSWADGYLTKTTPKLYRGLVCDAPFYVFYVRNDIKVCRAATRLRPSAPGDRSHSPIRFADAAYASVVHYRTLGPDGTGFCLDRGGYPEYYETTFTCGGVSSPPLIVGTKTRSRVDITLDNKAFLGWASDGFGNSPGGTWTLDVGYPLDDLNAGNYVKYTFDGFYNGETMMLSYDIKTRLSQTTETGYGIIVVPMYDSEAVYTSYWTHETDTSSNLNVLEMAADLTGFDYAKRWYVTLAIDGSVVEIIKYDENDGGPVSGASVISNTSTVPDPIITGTLTEKLICHAGAVDYVSTHADALHDNSAEVVETQYFTTSSHTVGSSAVVIAPGLIAAQGTPVAPFAVVLVGWT